LPAAGPTLLTDDITISGPNGIDENNAVDCRRGSHFATYPSCTVSAGPARRHREDGNTQLSRNHPRGSSLPHALRGIEHRKLTAESEGYSPRVTPGRQSLVIGRGRAWRVLCVDLLRLGRSVGCAGPARPSAAADQDAQGQPPAATCTAPAQAPAPRPAPPPPAPPAPIPRSIRLPRSIRAAIGPRILR
jgi:hypothetical protein